MRKFACLPILLILLGGCAQFGLEPASSLADRIAYAYGSHTAVLQATTGALNSGDIGSEDAERVLKVADESRKALDAARVAVSTGDVSSAEGRLQLATALLTELQTYLRRRSS